MLLRLAEVDLRAGDLDAAERHVEEPAEIFLDGGDAWGSAQVLAIQALVAAIRGREEDCRRLVDEAISLERGHGVKQRRSRTGGCSASSSSRSASSAARTSCSARCPTRWKRSACASRVCSRSTGRGRGARRARSPGRGRGSAEPARAAGSRAPAPVGDAGGAPLPRAAPACAGRSECRARVGGGVRRRLRGRRVPARPGSRAARRRRCAPQARRAPARGRQGWRRQRRFSRRWAPCSG